jgi:uncharacterized protein (DUF2164 family)
MLPKLAPEARTQAIGAIQRFFETERGERLGDLAAGNVLDLFASELGPHFFNLGVLAAKDRLAQVWEGVDEALELLQERP